MAALKKITRMRMRTTEREGCVLPPNLHKFKFIHGPLFNKLDSLKPPLGCCLAVIPFGGDIHRLGGEASWWAAGVHQPRHAGKLERRSIDHFLYIIEMSERSVPLPRVWCFGDRGLTRVRMCLAEGDLLLERSCLPRGVEAAEGRVVP